MTTPATKPKRVPVQWAPLLICIIAAVAIVAWIFFHTGRLPAATQVAGILGAVTALVGGVASHLGLSKLALSHDAHLIEAKYAAVEPTIATVTSAVPVLQQQVADLGAQLDAKVAESVKQAVAALPPAAAVDVNALADLVKSKIVGALNTAPPAG